MEDYAFFVDDPEMFCEWLSTLVQACGKAVIEQWQHNVRVGEISQVVQALLLQHYDPTYARSVERNFRGWSQALKAELKDRHESSLQDLAQQVLASTAHMDADLSA
jgi:tRNA 2-selenouridine synthase